MPERAYGLSNKEKKRLKDGLQAAFRVPIIDDVEDFVWEAVFHHVKGIRLPDPISEGRTKQLFDAVANDGRGWSLKTLVWDSQDRGSDFEFVAQRADIFKKAAQLGFRKGLGKNSRVRNLGRALIRHWNAKFTKDKAKQRVKRSRLAILLKDTSRKKFTYVEFAYPPLREDDYTWRWTRADRQGLQGLRDGRIRLKWYHGQQLFQVYRVPAVAYHFELDWTRLTLREFVRKGRANHR